MTNTIIKQMPRYESYKDSGVEWLGTVPEHWRVGNAKHVLKKLTRPRKQNGNTVICSNHGYSKLLGDVNQGLVSLTQHDYQGVNEGDLLVHGMDAWHGAISISKHTGDCTSVVHVCDSKHNKSYIAYYLKVLAIRNVYKVISNGVRQNTSDFRSWAKFGDIQILLPPIEEQNVIANFLDQKIEKIAESIANKQTQIERLKEHKQIVIQRAVTQGLNPAVPMKNSGVDYIGTLPAHWEVRRLKYVLEERNERSKTGEEPLFMVSQVHGLVVRADYHEKAEVAASNVDNKIVYKNDLVFNKLKAHLGVFFKSTIDFEGLVSPDYAVYSSRAYIKDMKILEILFRNPSYIEQFVIRATGIVEGLIRLYTSELFDIAVPIAPEKEQEDIIKYVESVAYEHDVAVKLQEEQISKLKEYRTTLIDSVVTGRVKVTELA